jgi:MFS family permease
VGLALVPSAVVAAVAPRFTPRVAHRLGNPRSLTVAAVMSCVSLFLAAWGVSEGLVAAMVSSVALVSIAFSLGQPALFAVVADLAALHVRGVAMGFATLVFLVCGSAGSAIVGGLSAVAGMAGGLLVLGGVCAVGALLAFVGPLTRTEPESPEGAPRP